jgi:hypothetical protein
MSETSGNSLGNTIYADTLIGMTISKAERFIQKNNVYFDSTEKNNRIREIRIEIRDGEGLPLDMSYRYSRLNVNVDKYVITKINGKG